MDKEELYSINRYFEYDKKKYLFDVVFVNTYLVLILLMAFIAYQFNILRFLMVLVMIVSIYSIWNALISKRIPQVVIIGEGYIIFRAFKIEERIKIEDISDMKIRYFVQDRKIFVRIRVREQNKKSFWIHTAKFSNGEELLEYMLDLEGVISPDSLKEKVKKSHQRNMM